MKRVAFAALVAACLAWGSANAAITLDMTFSDDTFGVSGHFQGVFDSLPADDFLSVSPPDVTCDLSPSTFYCTNVIVFHSVASSFTSGIQINVDGQQNVGLAFSFGRNALITPGVYQNENGYDFGHRATLTVTNTNVAPVPEPASWAALLLGFFGTGAMVRRRAATAGALTPAAAR